jgi:hypothetical protein
MVNKQGEERGDVSFIDVKGDNMCSLDAQMVGWEGA